MDAREPLPIETELQQSYVKGMQILKNLSVARDELPERTFKGGELDELIRVSYNGIYNADERGTLPVKMKRDHLNRRMGYSLDDIVKLQNFYDTSPSRSDDEPYVVLSFTNFKGGCWKTTTSLNFASYFANRGMRVLVIDLDPQASLTENLGMLPDVDIQSKDTLLPFIMNEDSAFPELNFADEEVGRIVRKTHLSTMDVIPCCRDMEFCTTWLTVANFIAEQQDDNDRIHFLSMRVKKLIAEIGDNYDIVIIDGTPSLNLLNENIIIAADEVIVPVPTEMTDWASTLKFTNKFEEKIAELADWLGNEEAAEVIPDINFLATRYSSTAKQTVAADEVLACIQHTWGDRVFENKIKKHDSVISNLGLIRKSVFDINSGNISTSVTDAQISNKARKAAVENFSAAFEEIYERCVKPYWASKKQPTYAANDNLAMEK